MGAVDDVDARAKASPLYVTYATRVDNQSAREMLAARLDPPAAAPAKKPGEAKPKPKPPAQQHKQAASATGGLDALGGFLNSRQGKQIQRQVTRGVFDMLKKQL